MGTAITPMQSLKNILAFPSVQEQFRNAMKDNAPLFIASLIDVFGNSNRLQKCKPDDVIMEALKAATLKLPINPNLGFAYIIPYGTKPQFQLGYKGLVQLAIRSGQYKTINAGIVYEGQKVKQDFLTGNMTIDGEPTSEVANGYFAYIELINGFSKGIYWTKEKVIAHAKKYSKFYNSEDSIWKKNPDAMSIKTVLINILSKYGILSVEMAKTISDEQANNDNNFEAETSENANKEVIDIVNEKSEVSPEETKDQEIPNAGF